MTNIHAPRPQGTHGRAGGGDGREGGGGGGKRYVVVGNMSTCYLYYYYYYSLQLSWTPGLEECRRFMVINVIGVEFRYTSSWRAG